MREHKALFIENEFVAEFIAGFVAALINAPFFTDQT